MKSKIFSKWENIVFIFLIICVVAWATWAITWAIGENNRSYPWEKDSKIEEIPKQMQADDELVVKWEKLEYDWSISLFVVKNPMEIKNVNDLFESFNLIQFELKNEIVGEIGFTYGVNNIIFEGDVEKTKKVLIEYLKQDNFHSGLFKYSFKDETKGGEKK